MVFHTYLLSNVNYKHFYGLFFTGHCWGLHFEPFSPEIHACRHRGAGVASVPPGASLWLQHLLLNLGILEKGRHKPTVPCWAGKLFCLLRSSQIAGLSGSSAPEFCPHK